MQVIPRDSWGMVVLVSLSVRPAPVVQLHKTVPAIVMAPMFRVGQVIHYECHDGSTRGREGDPTIRLSSGSRASAFFKGVFLFLPS